MVLGVSVLKHIGVFGTNGKLIVLDVSVLKHIRLFF